MIDVVQVNPESLLNNWQWARPLLATALSKGNGEALPEDMLSMARAGLYQVWFMLRDAQPIALGVTELVDHPRLSAVKVIVCAGVSMVDWKVPFDKALIEFAKTNGCSRIETTARLGFLKKLKDLGVKPAYLTFIQEVN